MRYDLISPRTRKDGKTFWVRVGAAFPRDGGYSLAFDALPLPDAEGRVSVLMVEHKPKNEQGGNQQGLGPDLGDSIPFSPEWRV